MARDDEELDLIEDGEHDYFDANEMEEDFLDNPDDDDEEDEVPLDDFLATRINYLED